jgi:hypothetical protein
MIQYYLSANILKATILKRSTAWSIDMMNTFLKNIEIQRRREDYKIFSKLILLSGNIMNVVILEGFKNTQ